MATKPKLVPPEKPAVKRKPAPSKLTVDDVQRAAKGGDEAFKHFIENGELPVR